MDLRNWAYLWLEINQNTRSTIIKRGKQYEWIMRMGRIWEY